MLVRAANRRIPRDILRQNIRPTEPFCLPWLCPSQQKYSQRTTRKSSTSPLASSEPPKKSTDRTYSTAAAAATSTEPAAPLPDFAKAFPTFRTSKVYPSHMPSLVSPAEKNRGEQAGPFKVVILDTPEAPTPKKMHTKDGNAVSNNKQEVIATFTACLSVGRLTRAQLMLSNLSRDLDTDSPDLIGMHNSFMEALLKRGTLEDGEVVSNHRVIFVWYEDKMVIEFGLHGDATTFALLLKASLGIDSDMDAERYVKYYVNKWKKRGEIREVLALPILTDVDVIKIAKMCFLKVSDLHDKQKEILINSGHIAEEPEIFSVPKVDPVKVRGHGLEAVKQSLRSLIDSDYIPSQRVEPGDIHFQIERQKLLEEDALESAQERWRKDRTALANLGIISIREGVNALLWDWHQAFVPLIREELNRVTQAENVPEKGVVFDRCLYGPFLRLLEPEKVAAIVMLELIRLHTSSDSADGVKTSRAVMAIARALESEYFAAEIQKRENKNIFGLIDAEELHELFRKPGAFSVMLKRARERVSDVEGDPTLYTNIAEWPVVVKAKLGAVLISMLLHCAQTPVTKRRKDTGLEQTKSQPAFYHSYEFIKGRKLGVLKLHEDITRRLSTEPLRRGTIGRLLPMVVTPNPWVAHDSGGYYYAQSKVVRTKKSEEQEMYVRAASARGDLDQLFSGLDVLGRTAWRINRKVFDVILDVWNTGEEFADIPATEIDEEWPMEPSPNSDPKVRYEWVQKMKILNTAKRNNHSQRCSVNFKLEIARAFLFERIYFPHNVDFRGRAYPIPPNLNHIGDDLSRGLLMFDEAKELGPNGLRWLKIHLANLAGYDKARFTERVRAADEHMDEIIDSATKPLNGKRWWLESEDPWQCLAVCIALKEALDLPDPSKYKCRLPVAQDGTCNGLQHYAALGGDIAGASQVNLEPSDVPQDVYTGVANLVREAVERDIRAGRQGAAELDGLVNRKVVKQTVMTNVYGVTFSGAREQIQARLSDTGKIAPKRVTMVSYYLAKKVFESMYTIFGGANKIQIWLAQCARMITRSVGPCQFEKLAQTEREDEFSGKPTKRKPRATKKSKKSKDGVEFMTSVVWTTPLGLPVVQPYREEKQNLIQTNLQNVYITDPSIIDQVNSRKQMTAFPPNFIHSLDATHMLMSALKCAEHEITFASVHDSFWTHPGDVDTLNAILREAFIKLHSEDIMAGVLAEFEERYKGYKYLASVKEGTQAAIEIKAARRKYVSNLPGVTKLTAAADLQWELERDRLLASEDPEERQLGKEMRTPSVILQESGEPYELQFGNKETQEGLDTVESDSTPSNKKETAEFEEIDASFEGPGIVEDIDEIEEEAVMEAAEAAGMEYIPSTNDGEETEHSTITEAEADADLETKKPKPKKVKPCVQVWVPLVFPPLPEKGEFDVKKCARSQYFFS